MVLSSTTVTGAGSAPARSTNAKSLASAALKFPEIWAFPFGILFVMVFMPVYYLFCGWIANLGLIVYMIVVIGGMATFGSTLTLPGIAGFILSVGMAVDTNILIFERMREEAETGKTARAVVSAGYHRAFSAIIDSHATTLITTD